MFTAILFKLTLVAQLIGSPGVLRALDEAKNATSQPAATQPSATQPAEGPSAGPVSVVDSLGATAFGKLFKGEKTLTPEEAARVDFWLKAAYELALTLIGIIPRILVALLFLFIFWLIHRGIRRMVVGSMKSAAVDSSIRDMLGSLLKWLIMGFGIVIACNQIGIQVTGLLTGVSLIGLAIGFAAQETLANFIAGIVIFWDKPFKIGDWLMMDGVFAQVQRVTFRSTRMLNLDGELIIMPNTQMLANKVSNHSTNPVNRIRVPIGIAYKESIDDSRRTLLATVEGDPRICAEPRPKVVVIACGASSVDLELRFWITEESEEQDIQFEYMEKAKKALDAAGIEIPFPHMQLFLEDTPVTQALTGLIQPTKKAG